VRHARPDDLSAVEPLLVELRDVAGLTERSPGVLYRGSHAFLHFHADPAGLFADLKVDGTFVRWPVSSNREQRALLAAARRAAS
jgi:hypothetical protein